MKILSNEKLIKRNNRIGQITSIGSLVILGVGMYFSFSNSQGTYVTLSFTTLIVGFILFQIGNYFLSRWGKSPRPDEIINASLKGLDDKYTVYHFSTDVSHLLIAPSGVYSLLPYGQGGTLSFDSKKNRWKQKGGNFFLKVFGQEGLGNPISEGNYAKEQLERYLLKICVGANQTKATALLVFTNEKAVINGEGSPVPYVSSEKLKDYLRKQVKDPNFSPESIVDLIDKSKKH
jgi:hypothetical protein